MNFASRLPRLLSCLVRSKQNRENLAQRPLEQLEPRQLLSVSLTPIANQVFAQGAAPQSLNLTQVFVDNTTGANDLTFAAKSDNTALIQTSIDNGIMTLTLAPTLSGYAHIGIVATAPDGASASETLRVQVTASADRMLSVTLGPGQRTFRYVESNNTIGTITLNGPGTGTIVMGGDGLVQAGDHARGANQEIESITLTGTTSASSLVINGVSKTKKRVTSFPSVGNITSDGALGTLRIKKDVVYGDVNIAGGVRTVNIDGAESETMTFGQSIGPVSLTFGNFIDVNFSTPAPLSSITGSQWNSSDSIPESFAAAYVTKIRATGNFDVGLQLTGTGAPAKQIGKINVAGYIGGTWTVPGASAPLQIGGTVGDFNGTFGSLPYIHAVGNFSGDLSIATLSYIKVGGSISGAFLDFTGTGSGNDLGSLTARGAILSSIIDSAGNLGPISAEALQGSIVYAGVGTLPQGQDLPSAASQLSATATINSITLHPRGKVVGFLGSDVAAALIGNLSLASTEVNNSGTQFGVAALSIGKLTVLDKTNKRALSFTKINNAATLASEIAAKNISLEDFQIVVLS